MTVAADLTKKIYTGNDVTTVFPYPFKIFQSADLLVVLTDTTVTPNTEAILTEGVDYTVSGVGDESGGNVTYPVSGDPLATGEKLTNWRVPAILQGTDFQNQGGFFAQTHENSFDLATMISQYLSEFILRAFALSVSDESGASLIIPRPEAGTVLGWNSLADALENVDPGSVALALPASDSIIANMINAAGTQTTLTKLLSGNTAIWQKGADVASAAVLPLLSDGNYNHVTGVAAVTSVATIGKGTLRIVKFTGVLVWTHHATNLINIGKADITTAADDHAIILEYDTGKWVMVDYQRANGLPLAVKDEDDMSSDSVVHLATQQSIKAFVESFEDGPLNSAATGSMELNGGLILNWGIHSFSSVGAGGGSGVDEIFDNAYSAACYGVYFGLSNFTAGDKDVLPYSSLITTSQFTLTLKNNGSSSADVDVLWIAVGV